MSHDRPEHGNHDGQPPRRPDGNATEHDAPPGAEQPSKQETLHGDGMESSRPEDGRRGRPDRQEERLVALIKQEVQQTTQYYFEAQPQLHSPEALRQYKEIDPLFPDRLLAMAEREQKAHIDADLLPIRAEAFAFQFTVVAVTLLPWALIIFGLVLILNGYDTAGYVAAIIGVIGGGAQMIGYVKPSRQGRPPSQQPKKRPSK